MAEIELDRARTTLADLRQQLEAIWADWRVANARLIRVLCLNPSTVVVPMEPPHWQITLIPLDCAAET